MLNRPGLLLDHKCFSFGFRLGFNGEADDAFSQGRWLVFRWLVSQRAGEVRFYQEVNQGKLDLKKKTQELGETQVFLGDS